MFYRYADVVSYEISDDERQLAEKSIRYLDYCMQALKEADRQLDLIADPLGPNPDIPGEELFKERAHLRIIRDEVADKYNIFKHIAYRCYTVIAPFMSDDQMDRVFSSFGNSIEELEEEVNEFIALFDNLKSDDFAKEAVAQIEKIHEASEEVRDIVEQRIKDHILNDIIANNPMSNIGREFREKVENKSPLLMQLIEDRNK